MPALTNDRRYSDTELISLMKCDPDAALRILAATRIRAVLARLRSSGYCTDDEKLDEIRADLLVYVWLQIDRYDPDRGPLAAWLFSIARNKAKWAYSPKHPVSASLGHQVNSVVHKAHKPGFGSRQKHNALHEAIRSLPARQSKLVELDLASSSGRADTRDAMLAIDASTPNAVYGVRKRYIESLADPRRHRKLHSVMKRLGRRPTK